MSTPPDMPEKDAIARVAHAIWEAEGRPDGRDQDHWTLAEQLVAEGRAAGIEGADSDAPEGGDDRAARPLRKAPKSRASGAGEADMPGPRNPAPEPPTNADGYVAVPSDEATAGRALADDPQPPQPAPRPRRSRPKPSAA